MDEREKLIEAVAQAIHTEICYAYPDKTVSGALEVAVDCARSAYNAIAPLIRAEALEEAASRIDPAHNECCDPAAYDRGECCGKFIPAQAAIRALKEGDSTPPASGV